MSGRVSFSWAAASLAGAMVVACSESTSHLASDAPAAGGGGTVATSVDAGAPSAIALELCSDGVCACANGVDDDGDGDIDGFDPECTGANDDDEGSFATGIPGDNRDPTWQDCFYDGNSGAGDDGCRYNTGCLTGELAPGDEDCQVASECVQFCRPRTPNGCDCFGCCTVDTPTGGQIDVLISEECTFEAIEKCQPCTPTQTECRNDCGRCELCLGKTVDELPADCSEDTDAPPNSCDDGELACDASHPCGTGSYCSQGCCLVYVL